MRITSKKGAEEARAEAGMLYIKATSGACSAEELERLHNLYSALENYYRSRVYFWTIIALSLSAFIGGYMAYSIFGIVAQACGT